MAQKQKKNTKWIYWLIMVVLFVAAGVVAYMVWDNYFSNKKEDRQEEQVVEEAEKKESAEKAEDVEKGKDEAERAVEQKKVEQYDGDDPNAAEELSGAITYAGVANGVLMVRVNIDQYLEGGQCELNLARGGSVIYNSVTEVVGGPATSSCAGFDVAVSELGTGAIEINVGINSGERSGMIRGEANI